MVVRGAVGCGMSLSPSAAAGRCMELAPDPIHSQPAQHHKRELRELPALLLISCGGHDGLRAKVEAAEDAG